MQAHKMTTRDMEVLRKENRCFKCKAQGHEAQNCQRCKFFSLKKTLQPKKTRIPNKRDIMRYLKGLEDEDLDELMPKKIAEEDKKFLLEMQKAAFA